ncbi:unnamed protein product [Protopolystoma xenopodis]|uniref:Major facilitator superfamily (MFS) profile domain-containing protein n=1 Tax=Protopolystoma xenopodis TaxID=117903 RepID=A0A448WWH9_9PLAT|nr:unnamed protein product [Protopolystoma xenopodis]
MQDPPNFQDRGWAWFIVFGAFIVHFLTAGLEKTYSIWYVEIMREYQSSAAATSGIAGVFASIRLLFGPAAVTLSKRFSMQSVVISGGLLTFTGLLIAALSRHFVLLMIGYGFIYGFGLTLVFTPALVICTIYFNRLRATALSISLSGAGFGAFLLPPLIVLLISLYGYYGAMLVVSGFTLNYCVAGAIFVSPLHTRLNPQPIEKKTPMGPDDPAKGECTPFVNGKEPRRLEQLLSCGSVYIEILGDKWFSLFLFAFIFNMMGSGPVTTLVLHYSEEQGLHNM